MTDRQFEERSYRHPSERSAASRGTRQPSRRSSVQEGRDPNRPPRTRSSAPRSSSQQRSAQPRSTQRRPEQRRSVQRRSSASAAPTITIGLPHIIAVVVLVVLIVIGLRSCAGCSNQSSSQDSTPTVSAPTVNEGTNDWEESVKQLYGLLETEYADALCEAAKTDPDVAWMITHIDDYGVDGQAVQCKLLKLAAVEPAARTFVREFPDKYPAEQGQPCDPVTPGTVPLLHQWDQRWGYTVYCSTAFATTGCCPTAFAMIYQGITGKNDRSPYDMGQLAYDRGYMDEFNGTSPMFLTDCAAELGLYCEEVPASEDYVRQYFANGYILIGNMAPGDFTTTGHYIVITGINSEDKLVVNDPYSEIRSNMTWDISTVADQAISFFAFRAA